MSLQYTNYLDIKVETTTLDFSTRGTKLAAITSDGFLNVWNLDTGKQYYPAPGPCTSRKSCIRWTGEASFICGFEDGYALLGWLGEDSTLSVCRTKWANYSLSILSFHKDTGLLAAGNAHNVGIWKNDDNNWVFLNDLPHSDPNSTITSLEWLSENELLVTYLDNGLVIWNVDSLEVVRSLKPKHGRQIHNGVFCYGVQKFAALNELRKLDIYDIQSGQIWSPSWPQNISLVKAVHRGSCILAAGLETSLPELVDIANTRVSALFPQGATYMDTEPVVTTTAIATYQDEEEETFMIATASSVKTIVWRAELPKKQKENCDTCLEIN